MQAEEIARLEAEVEALRLRVDEQDRLLAMIRDHKGGCTPADVCFLLSQRLLEALVRLRELGEFYSRSLFVKQMSQALQELDCEESRKRFRRARMRKRDSKGTNGQAL